jgi:ribosome modulation factor
MTGLERMARAWSKGWAAAREGRPGSSNPYSAVTIVLWEKWYAGWQAGMAQNEQEEQEAIRAIDRECRAELLEGIADYQGREAAALREDLANRCPHGVPYPDNCSACDHAADLAYDTWREGQR